MADRMAQLLFGMSSKVGRLSGRFAGKGANLLVHQLPRAVVTSRVFSELERLVTTCGWTEVGTRTSQLIHPFPPFPLK
jgi:hypothetical protein